MRVASGSNLTKVTLPVGRFQIPIAIAGDAPRCLVCVNGMQQTMATWRSLLRAFTCDTNYRVVVFDFPTQGRARIDHGAAETTLEEQIEVLDAVVRFASPHAPVALFGGSWGAVVSAVYAASAPARVESLLLGSFSASPTAALRDITRRGQALIDRGDPEGLGRLFVDGFGDHMRPAAQARLREQFSRLAPEQLRQMHASGEMMIAHDDIAAFADLGRITARTLILIGGNDPLVDPAGAEAAAERIPRCAVQVLPGVGHFLHIEQPELLDVYRAFFDGAAAEC